MKERFQYYKQLGSMAKLGMLVLMILISSIVVTILGVIIAIPLFGSDVPGLLLNASAETSSQYVNFMKYMQIVSHVGMFILPALFFAIIFENGNMEFYLLNRRQHWLMYIIAPMSIILLLPFVNFLSDMNANLVLPESMSRIEEWMKQTEETAGKLTELFLASTTIKGLVLNLIMIALIPAIGEELIFRGILMRKLSKLVKNQHVAIWLSAIIFSAFHLQFYGFLPRLFLGVVLGYFLLWSGTLKLSIVVHFVNNAFAVVLSFLYAKGVLHANPDSIGNYTEQPMILIPLIIFGFFALFFYRFISKKANPYFKQI